MQGPSDEPGSRGLPQDTPWAADAPPRPAYGTLRLQPVLLGPPPEAGADVTADDDLTPAELGSRPRTGLYAGIAAFAVVAAMAGVAFVALREPPDPTAEQSPAPVAVQPVAPPTPPPTVSAAPSPAAAPVDMGRIDSDLVPPTTEGLSPARRVQTIPIRVENDREVPAPR
jgi:hypothetical protein